MPLRVAQLFPTGRFGTQALEAFGSNRGSSQCETCNMKFQLHRFVLAVTITNTLFVLGRSYETLLNREKDGVELSGDKSMLNKSDDSNRPTKDKRRSLRLKRCINLPGAHFKIILDATVL